MQSNFSVFLNLGFREQLRMFKCEEPAIELTEVLLYFMWIRPIASLTKALARSHQDGLWNRPYASSSAGPICCA